MRNLVASFISLQALLTILYWAFIIKSGGILCCILPILWILAVIQITIKAFKQNNFDVFIWWFAYFDVFLATTLILLVVIMPISAFFPFFIFPGIIIALLLSIYITEKYHFLRVPSFENSWSEIYFKFSANLPLVPILFLSLLGA